jgi:hypothetical protein
MTDLTDEEKRALIALLRETLEHARFPLAPRWDPLKAILAKLERRRRPHRCPPLPASGGPRVGDRDGETVVTEGRVLNTRTYPHWDRRALGARRRQKG